MDSATEYYAAKAALEWQVELGADEAIGDEPLNRYELLAEAPKPKSAPVAKAAPEFSPNKLIATATANSKKLEVPIIAHGAATLNGTFNRHAEKYAMAKIPYDWIKSGIAINRIKTG